MIHISLVFLFLWTSQRRVGKAHKGVAKTPLHIIDKDLISKVDRWPLTCFTSNLGSEDLVSEKTAVLLTRRAVPWIAIDIKVRVFCFDRLIKSMNEIDYDCDPVG